MLEQKYYMRIYRQLTAIVMIGSLCWAFFSDALISLFARYMPVAYLEYMRGANNTLIFGITALFLYYKIRKHQQLLILSEKQYRGLFESNPNPMWIYNRETLAFVAVNEAAIGKYEYSREEFLDMTIKDIRSTADHALLDEAIKGNPGGLHEADVWKHFRRSGAVFAVSIVSHDVAFNGLNCKMVMATDISQIIENEQKLRAAYRKEKMLHEELATKHQSLQQSEKESRIMGQVMNKINNLVIIVQEDRTISWVNRAFTDFTGYALSEVSGKNPGEILFGPKTDQEMISRLVYSVGQKKFFSGELINYKKNNEPYWIQLNLSPIYDESGTFQFYISVEMPITERKENERKILAQHTALQRVAWLNSHELRRPVCSIIGLISVLKNAEDKNERSDCLAALEACAKELDHLVKDINQNVEHLELIEGHQAS
jgi:PAS domain S-box-containing protein